MTEEDKDKTMDMSQMHKVPVLKCPINCKEGDLDPNRFDQTLTTGKRGTVMQKNSYGTLGPQPPGAKGQKYLTKQQHQGGKSNMMK